MVYIGLKINTYFQKIPARVNLIFLVKFGESFQHSAYGLAARTPRLDLNSWGARLKSFLRNQSGKLIAVSCRYSKHKSL
jgi:hypothetical protein